MPDLALFVRFTGISPFGRYKCWLRRKKWLKSHENEKTTKTMELTEKRTLANGAICTLSPAAIRPEVAEAQAGFFNALWACIYVTL